MNNTTKFNQKADLYSFGRPSYANALIDMLYSQQGFTEQSVIADIGSGTGILTKQLLQRGSYVYAVEPNADMRCNAEAALKSFTKFKCVNGTAEHTTLENCSVHFITVAQAFHWFNVLLFKDECKRILKRNGKVFLIWNKKDHDTAVSIEQNLIFEKFCPNFVGSSGGIKENDEKIKLFFDDSFECVQFDNPLLYDREKFVRRSLSSSYSLTKEDKNYDEYLNELNNLFDKHAKNGLLSTPNKTVAYFNLK